MNKYFLILIALFFATNSYAQTTVNTTTDSKSDVKTEGKTIVISPPPSAISPSIGSSSSDLCTTGVSGAVQTQILGVSAGEMVRAVSYTHLRAHETR